jgi:HK97 family phage prohead protease
MSILVPRYRAASGDTSLSLGDRDESWDAGAAKKALDPSDYKRAFFWRDPDGDPKTLAAYKLPFASPSGGLHAVWAGVTAAAAAVQGSRGGVDIPSDDVAGVKAKIEAFYTKAKKKYDDDSIEVPWGGESTLHAGRERLLVAPITGLNVRDAQGTGDGSWIIEGYAAVFEAETTLFDLGFYRMREVITRGAFAGALAKQPLVHLNHGHDMKSAVASTAVEGIGGLELAEDFHGLRFVARVDPADPDAVRLAAKLRRGVVRQASFAFTIEAEELDSEGETPTGGVDELWRINKIRDLFDVCCAAQGAYPQTESHLRGLAAASFGRAAMAAGLPGRPLRGPESVAITSATNASQTVSGPAVVQRPDAERAARAEARRRERERALALYPPTETT